MKNQILKLGEVQILNREQKISIHGGRTLRSSLGFTDSGMCEHACETDSDCGMDVGGNQRKCKTETCDSAPTRMCFNS
mgnify:CR=1 FL=1